MFNIQYSLYGRRHSKLFTNCHVSWDILSCSTTGSSCLDYGTVFHCPTWNTEHRTSRHEISNCVGPPGIMVALVYKVLPGSKLKQSHFDKSDSPQYPWLLFLINLKIQISYLEEEDILPCRERYFTLKREIS